MDTQLQIVISLINDAAGQLTEVGSQLATLGTQANEAAEQMSSSLTTAEEAAADAAMAAISEWTEASDEIAEAVSGVATDADAAFANISDAALSAASQASESWQQSLAEIQEIGAMTQEQVDTSFTQMGEASEAAATTAGSSLSSMHSYFRALIVAYASEQIGQSLLGGVEAAVTAAAGDPEKVAQLTDEINQQKASIASAEVELTKWQGTTAQVSAAHEKAATDISAAKEKIQELTLQLQPLLAQQQAGGQAAIQYAAATEKLNDDWQKFLATSGAPLLQLLTKLAVSLDDLINKLTAFAAAHPKVTEAVLIFMGVLGGVLIVAGTLFAAFVILMVAITLLGGTFIAVAASIAVAVAAIAAAVVVNWNAVRSETTKLITDFEAAWNALKTWWDTFWDALYTTIENAWSKISAIISAIESAISKVTGPIAAIAGAVGGNISSALTAVTHVQDAIITPSGIVQTDPADYLIATKTPGALGGGGGVVNVYIQGGNYLDQSGATLIASALATQIGRQLKLKNFF